MNLQPLALMTFGPTQVTKSTFINVFGNCENAKTGNGSGQSVTSCAKIYQINHDLIKYIIDLPGIFDSRGTISDESILNMTKQKVLEVNSFGSSLKGFLVFESLGSELNNLKITLAKLCSIFTDQVLKSVIVIAAKSDITRFPKKRVALYNYCQEKNLKIVSWTNYTDKITAEQKAAQENELKQAILDIPTVNADWIGELQNKVKEKAQVIASQQPVPNVNQINAKAQELANQAPSIPVTRYRSTTRSVAKQRNDGYWKDSGGFIGWIVGRQRWVDNWVTYYVNEYFQEPYTSYEKPPYTAFTEESKRILAPKPVESFYGEANMLLQKEIQEKLALDNSNRS